MKIATIASLAAVSLATADSNVPTADLDLLTENHTDQGTATSLFDQGTGIDPFDQGTMTDVPMTATATQVLGLTDDVPMTATATQVLGLTDQEAIEQGIMSVPMTATATQELGLTEQEDLQDFISTEMNVDVPRTEQEIAELREEAGLATAEDLLDELNPEAAMSEEDQASHFAPMTAEQEKELAEYLAKQAATHEKSMKNHLAMCLKNYDFGKSFCRKSKIVDCAEWNEAKAFSCRHFGELKVHDERFIKNCMELAEAKMRYIYREVQSDDFPVMVIIPFGEKGHEWMDHGELINGQTVGTCFEQFFQFTTEEMVLKSPLVDAYKEMTAYLTKPSAKDLKKVMRAWKREMKKAKPSGKRRRGGKRRRRQARKATKKTKRQAKRNVRGY